MMVKPVNKRQCKGHERRLQIVSRQNRLFRRTGPPVNLSNGNLDPRWRMVAGLFPRPRFAIDSGLLEDFAERRAEQGVIDADAGVPSERVPPIMPEGINALVRVKRPQGVGPALSDQRA